MGSRTGKKPLIILIIIIIVLFLSVLWSVNKVGGYVGSISIPRAYLCKEIQQNVTPMPFTTEKLYPDQKQVCIWFEYERAKNGDKIKISCYKDKKLIAEQFVILTSKNGARAFYLIKGDGTGLPIGKYRVVLSTAIKVWYKFDFEVIPKPKPTVIKKLNVKKTKIKSGGAKRAKNKKNYRARQQRSRTERHYNHRHRRHR